MTVKVSMCSLAPLQVRKRVEMDNALLWLPHRRCIVKIYRKYCWTFNFKNFEILLVGQVVLQMTTNELNFKVTCNCIHELLNVFDNPAQRVYTIANEIICTAIFSVN